MPPPAPINRYSTITNGGFMPFAASIPNLSLWVSVFASLWPNASTFSRSRRLRTAKRLAISRAMKTVVFFLLSAMGMAEEGRAENDKSRATGVQTTEPLLPSKRPLVGAIRWDGWGLTGDVGKGSEQVLGLAKYQHRAPFFVAEAGADFIRFKPYSQEIMDTEIDYAVHAGIDYWAFCWYPPGCGLEVARNLFLSSRKQERPKWCVILGTNPFDMGRDAPWLAAEFAKPEYQKVLDGRPLVYVFTPMPSADLSTLRELSMRSCGKSPYVAMMGWTATSAAQACEAVGADAITRYAGGEWGSWEDYAKVKELIPNVGIGWDPTPFRDTPMPWYPPVAKDFVGSTATPKQIVAGMDAAFSWIRANPTKVPANTLLIYAWNEHAEGGWLCPTFTPQGPNTEKIDALHEWLSMQPH